MVFSSSIFLFFFLPLVLGAYFLSPSKLRNFTLLLFSLLFYSWGEDIIVAVMIGSAVIDYSCGLLMASGRRKIGLLISILANVGLLGFFKYFNFTFDNLYALAELLGTNPAKLIELPEIALPIGISFYTFQTMSYSIDVYRGNVQANRNFIDFACYVTMFPQLVAGPIVRYIDVHHQLQNKNISASNFRIGIERFVVGLAKKVLIANTFAAIADDVFAQNFSDLSTPYAWFGTFAYTVQIYFDFSGYSDMAIGLGKMFGFDFPENFNYPYIARSIKEFWRRWHISLSSWFRDYLYISLGGNRKGNNRTYVNLFIVFFVTGLWHGASWNFVVWGLYHGVFIVIERGGFENVLAKLSKPIQHFYTLLVVMIGWVFFRAETLTDAVDFLQVMFIPQAGTDALNSYLSYFHFGARPLIMSCVAVIFAMPFYRLVNDQLQLEERFWLRVGLLFILFATSVVFVVSGSYNPFIYFRF